MHAKDTSGRIKIFKKVAKISFIFFILIIITAIAYIWRDNYLYKKKIDSCLKHANITDVDYEHSTRFNRVEIDSGKFPIVISLENCPLEAYAKSQGTYHIIGKCDYLTKVNGNMEVIKDFEFGVESCIHIQTNTGKKLTTNDIKIYVLDGRKLIRVSVVGEENRGDLLASERFLKVVDFLNCITD